ncbi:MAG TPA: hypothetical protein VFX25_23395 [Streptosporangiaceae bacterium]|nr:hypothetical protein [Streptosporangiaceae bacterium]
MPAAPSASAAPSMGGMPGMNTTAAGNGLADSSGGYRLTSRATTLPAGRPAAYRFAIIGPGGKPVTDFEPDQARRLHFYAIRSDLTGFQHLHPVMAQDGTWTASLASLTPGSWRLFTAFVPAAGPGAGTALVLSRTATVPGPAAKTALPAPAATTTADGYTVTVTGQPAAGRQDPLAVTVTRDGKPVTDLEPYLDTYAHLTAFHDGDEAFAHLHPDGDVSGDRGGPSLPFHADFAQSGNWRLFLQFQTAGRLHTAALTLHVA